MVHCRDHDSVLFFTDRGRVFTVRAFDIPEPKSTSNLGTPMTRMGWKLSKDENVTAMLPVISEQPGGDAQPTTDWSTRVNHTIP